MSKQNKPNVPLIRARERLHSTATDAAKAIGMNDGTYRSYENGNRPVTPKAAIKFAKHFGGQPQDYCDTLAAIGGRGGEAEIEVLGEAQVGIWRDLSLEDQGLGRNRTITVVNPTGKRRWAIKIADQSVNRLLKKGWFAVLERAPSESPREYRDGQFVFIQRIRGGLTEESVRRVEVIGDKCTLTCYSTEKRYEGERLPFPPRSKDEQVIVAALVVGGYFDI